MAQTFSSYKDFEGFWPWQNFSPREISCKCCGEMYLSNRAMDALQALRDIWGKPIHINSAHRCANHNLAVGGAAKSQHLTIAFDCVCPAADQSEFIRDAKQAGFTGIGRYPDQGFVHIDMGPRREWHG